MTPAQAAALEGDTAPPDLDAVVNLHFVALVERGGRCTSSVQPHASVPYTSASNCTQDAAALKEGSHGMYETGIHG